MPAYGLGRYNTENILTLPVIALAVQIWLVTVPSPYVVSKGVVFSAPGTVYPLPVLSEVLPAKTIMDEMIQTAVGILQANHSLISTCQPLTPADVVAKL